MGIAALPQVHGPFAWPACMARLHGPLAWPVRIALRMDLRRHFTLHPNALNLEWFQIDSYRRRLMADTPRLTTSAGAPVPSNDTSKTAGSRGPVMLDD